MPYTHEHTHIHIDRRARTLLESRWVAMKKWCRWEFIRNENPYKYKLLSGSKLQFFSCFSFGFFLPSTSSTYLCCDAAANEKNMNNNVYMKGDEKCLHPSDGKKMFSKNGAHTHSLHASTSKVSTLEMQSAHRNMQINSILKRGKKKYRLMTDSAKISRDTWTAQIFQ